MWESLPTKAAGLSPRSILSIPGNRKEAYHMAKTKIEKIASIEEEIKQLKERQRLLRQQHNAQERKDRTKRLCRRMGLFESLVPGTIPLTEEQFKTFLEKTVATEHSRRILDGLAGQNAATAAIQGMEPVGKGNNPPDGKTAHTAQGSRGDGGGAQG